VAHAQAYWFSEENKIPGLSNIEREMVENGHLEETSPEFPLMAPYRRSANDASRDDHIDDDDMAGRTPHNDTAEDTLGDMADNQRYEDLTITCSMKMICRNLRQCADGRAHNL
jgi:hypothetical protein